MSYLIEYGISSFKYLHTAAKMVENVLPELCHSQFDIMLTELLFDQLHCFCIKLIYHFGQLLRQKVIQIVS